MSREPQDRPTKPVHEYAFLRPLRILLLEDDPEDRALCIRALKKAGFQSELETADTRDSFLSKLKARAYDVILSDYSIPGWNGLAAFHAVKEAGKDIPFILVTGTLGEEAAVELIREGIDDYVLKDRLVRLPEAIRRALDERTTREERSRAVRALRGSEERVRLLLDSTAEAIFGLDLEGNCTFCNAACVTLLGYESDLDLLGKNMHAQIQHSRADGTPLPAEECGLAGTLQHGASAHVDDEDFWKKDGTNFPVAYRSRPVFQEGELVGAVVTFVDITQQKRHGEIVRQLAAIVEHSDDAIIGLTLDGLVFSWNRGAERMYGYSAAEMISKPIHTLAPSTRSTEVNAILERIKGGKEVRHYETVHAHKRRTLIHVSLTVSPIKDSRGRIVGISGIARDISDLRQADDSLRRMAAAINASHDAIMTISLPDAIIRSWNVGAERIYGYPAEETVGKPLEMLTSGERKNEVLEILDRVSKGETVDQFEAERVRKDGKAIHVALTVSPIKDPLGRVIGTSAIVRDITERKRMEQHVLHARKLEAVGGLAAGIAHEINTPIQFVGDNARFLQESFGGIADMVGQYEALCQWARQTQGAQPAVGQAEKAREKADWDYLREEVPKALAQMLEGVDRVARIVRAMKEFSHVDQSGEKAAADLNKALESTLIVARNELKYVAEVETDYGELPAVMCHVGDLNQVFLNLLVNAAHAIGDVVKDTNNRGQIRVTTRQEEDCVEIAISDTGAGIPEAIRDKIFNPFFTTKQVGKGSGQGLALARAIVVEKHGGALTFETETGKGTTFRVRLPLNAVPAKELALP